MTRAKASAGRCPDCAGALGADEGTSAFCAGCGAFVPRGEWITTAVSTNGREANEEDVAGGERLRRSFGPIVSTLSTVKREEVDWLWYGRLALGKPTCLMGDPGVGKSFVTASIGTRISLGSPLPGEEESREPADVLFLACEDGLADTIVPRFQDMGADMARLHVMTGVVDLDGRERHPSLVDDLPDIERALVEHHCRLLVIDPINAYLGSQLDTHRDAALRGALAPLSSLCERKLPPAAKIPDPAEPEVPHAST